MKEDVIVVDEFLSKSYFNELSYLVSSDVFPWSYNKEISNTNNDNRLGSYGFQFHMIMHGNYRQCRELDISLGCLKTIQDYIGANSIFKARYLVYLALKNIRCNNFTSFLCLSHFWGMDT